MTNLDRFLGRAEPVTATIRCLHYNVRSETCECVDKQLNRVALTERRRDREAAEKTTRKEQNSRQGAFYKE